MGQAVVDLPDPLDSPRPAEGESADDLLSKLAGDEIDRMLAETEGGGVEPEPPPVAVAVEPVSVVAESPVTEQVDLDDVLNTAEAERAALKEHPVPEAGIESAAIDLGVSAEKRRSLPLIFKPLVWISAPLDPWPDQLREMLGKVGLITLVNALGVIAYVLLFKRHH